MVLTTIPRDPLLDLDPWVGQRSCSFRFHVTDAVSKAVLGTVTPIRGASLTHDTGKTIKRQLQANFGVADTAAINPLTERITVYMVFGDGTSYRLGTYMFTTVNYQQFTSGQLSNASLYDEMFLVDQQLRNGFSNGFLSINEIVQELLRPLPVQFEIEPTEFSNSTAAWSVGTTRGVILEALAVAGDYFSPWFDNKGIMRMIRTFNPADRLADFDFDNGNHVFRDNITSTSDLLTAPNTIIVISNTNTSTVPITSVVTVPTTAPNSIPNRGFEIAQTFNLQLDSPAQADAVANGLAQRLQVVERVTLTTPPDPRHDSYNVIRWQGSNWLELSWSMALVEGGRMNHLLRKAYV